MERFFKLSESNTTVGIELSAGLTTFMAMAYIAFVNPQMMASAGMDQGAAFVATCIAAAVLRWSSSRPRSVVQRLTQRKLWA